MYKTWSYDGQIIGYLYNDNTKHKYNNYNNKEFKRSER